MPRNKTQDSSKLNRHFQALNWPTLDADQIEILQSAIRGGAQKRQNIEASQSPFFGPQARQYETKEEFNPYGVCHIGWKGDLVKRDANGKLLDAEGGKGTHNRTNPDGSITVMSELTEATYYPLAPKGSTKSDQPLSMLWDKKTGTVEYEFIRADGSVYTQRTEDPPPLNGPAGFTPKPIDMVNPTNDVAHITYHQRTDGTGTTLIYHRDVGTADVINHDGSPTLHVDPYTDEILHLGTKDYPVEGPAAGRFYNLKSDQVQMHPTYEPPPDSGKGFLGLGYAPTAVGNAAGGYVEAFETPDGKHMAPGIIDYEKYVPGARGVGYAGDAFTVYSVVDGAVEYSRSGNPTRLAGAIGEAGVNAAGASTGAILGAKAGTLVSPGLGTVIGAILGGVLVKGRGTELGMEVVDMYYEGNRGYLWRTIT